MDSIVMCFGNPGDSSNKEKWYLDDSHDLIVNGIETNIGLLPQDRINTGVIIVEKSKNGKKWEQTGEIYNDFFDENQKGKDAFYISTKEETINGMYYRVIVAYQLKRRIIGSRNYEPIHIVRISPLTQIRFSLVCICI